MEKENFIEVLKHYSECTEEEALKILSLKESYPYSQLLHALSARVSKDHQFVNHQKELQLAAVYAADRSVLKDVITLDNLLPKRPTASAKPEVKKVVAASPSVAPQAVTVVSEPDDADSLADQVLSDLEKLHQLKHNFEQMFIDGGNAAPENITSESEKKLIKQMGDKESSAHKESSKNRKARIVEIAKAMAAAREESAVEEPKPKPKKKTQAPDNYLDEIAVTKKALEPENEKQKEQLEIIDHFIKTQPSIINPKEKATATPAGDLASIKAGEFNDNVVSETLVEILIKQGKKDKAIELLKKLIWKFPQKKAYFAAQIEELKSN